jgi:hypothetical protein
MERRVHGEHDSVKSPTDGEAMALFQGRKKEKKDND